MLGTCRFCGETQEVLSDSAEMANEIATNNCSCREVKRYHKKEDAHKKINYILGPSAERNGFVYIHEDAVETICRIADMVIENKVEKVKISLIDGTVDISRDSDDNLKISRKRTVKINATTEEGK